MSTADAGLTTKVDNKAAEVIVKEIFFRAGTVGNVQGDGVDGDTDGLTRRASRRDSPPGRGRRSADGILEP